MDDLAYLVPESARAWLEGHGDGRFESYERYYRRALNRGMDALDVEGFNKQYETYARERVKASAVKVGHYLVTVTVIGFGLYLLAKVVVSGSDVAPKMTGVLLLAGIVARKVFQRRQRAAAVK
jgi:hypothetical protein